MSEYMADILQDIDVTGTRRRVKIKSRFADEEKLAASLQKLQGESFQVPGNRRSELFNFTRSQFQSSEPETSQTQPSSEAADPAKANAEPAAADSSN